MRKKKTSGTTRAVGSDALTGLALDLRWSWQHASDELWSELDPELWARTHNAWVVLQVASPAKLDELLARPTYREQAPTWPPSSVGASGSRWSCRCLC
jgi:hypothetical protein